MFRKITSAFILLGLCIALRPALAQRQYFVTDLGTVQGSYGSQTTDVEASGINNSAQIVGNAADGSGEIGTRAFLWQNGSIQSENNPNNGVYLYFKAINNNGQVAGSSDWSGRNAVLWQNGITTVLGSGQGYGINDSGEVVGESNGQGFVYGPATYFSSSYTMNNLGTLGGSYSQANGINNNDVIVGTSELSNYTNHAFAARLESRIFWIGFTPFIFYFYEMYDLDAGLGATTQAYAINDNDLIAGQEFRGDGSSYPVLYQFDRSTDTVTWKAGLGSPYSDYPYNSAALAVNNANVAVGYFNSAYHSVACLWDQYGAQDLNNCVSSSLGWRLYTAQGINANGQILCNGVSGGLTHAFLLSPIALASLNLHSASVVGGNSVTGTVSLNHPAVSATTVTLTSANAAATVPYSVTIPAGALSANFTITTGGVSTTTTGNIQANYNGTTLSAALSVNPAALSGLSLSSSTVAGSLNVTGKVSLNGKAPTGGSVVTLTNTNPAATVPASVTVAAGTASTSFTIKTVAVASAQTGTVKASYNGVSKSHTLTVRPIGVKTVHLTPNPVVGGHAVTVTVTLEAPAAPGHIVVTLTSSNTATAHPTVGSITIQAGSQTGTFTIQTAATLVSKSATISASANGVAHSALLKVNP
jgi:probable HAF family extracellular repeat protein